MSLESAPDHGNIQSHTTVKQCRICRNNRLHEIINLGEQYLTGQFPRSINEQISKGPLELIMCDGATGCGLVQLRHSYNSSELYGNNYGYRSGLNKSMVKHLDGIAGFTRQYVTFESGDVVLDIGSNDGTFLSFFGHSGLKLIGVDPTGEKFRSHYLDEIQLISDFFSVDGYLKSSGNKTAKLISSVAMFYDLEDPSKFMREVNRILSDDGVWYLEQSYLPAMLKANAYDTICHEHLEYYTLSQIKWMADRAALKIIDVRTNDANGGSIGITLAKTTSSLAPNHSETARILKLEENGGFLTTTPYFEFATRIARHRDDLKKLLAGIKDQGKRILGYGASTKGNVILQYCNIGSSELPFIADVNEDKFGCFTPGSLIPIISEAEAHRMNPDYFLVLPWHFKENLLEREASFLTAGGKMIFPFPEIEIVSR
jgi:SAM-dependent methyltransferase